MDWSECSKYTKKMEDTMNWTECSKYTKMEDHNLNSNITGDSTTFQRKLGQLTASTCIKIEENALYLNPGMGEGAWYTPSLD
jgi:hypothetical protein